jgi:hypothetical protein
MWFRDMGCYMKLLEFNYTIEYKKGSENAVANALSRRVQELSAISSAIPAWISDIENSYISDEAYTTIIQQILVNPDVVPHYSVHAGILRYKGRVCIGTNTDLRTKIISSLHSSTIRGHSGVRATHQRIKRIFHWPNLKKSVESFVSQCPVYQRVKAEHCQYPGLLAPLPIPDLA